MKKIVQIGALLYLNLPFTFDVRCSNLLALNLYDLGEYLNKLRINLLIHVKEPAAIITKIVYFFLLEVLNRMWPLNSQ